MATLTGNFMTLANTVHRPVFERVLGYLSGQTRCVKIKLKVKKIDVAINVQDRVCGSLGDGDYYLRCLTRRSD